jgi:hypothetical protein
VRKEKLLEMRGTDRKYFVVYFEAIGHRGDKEGSFCGPFWEVELSEQDFVILGVMKFPRTFITFSVEEDHFDEFLSAFQMAFMRAGG